MLDENYGYKPENGGFQDFGMIVDFNASTKEEVEQSIEFLPILPGVVSYRLKTTEEELFIAYNAGEKEVTLELPEGTFGVYVNKTQAGVELLEKVEKQVVVAPVSAMVLKKVK